jgi:serine/threonine protein phosphatase 1
MPLNRLKRLFTREPPPPPPLDARGPHGSRVYAIGDVHGRLDLLTELMTKIEADARGFAGPVELVFLGDYVDRGPHSCEVIEWLVRQIPQQVRPRFLRGNHEDVLLKLWENELPDEVLAGWLTYGGRETLSSYGLGAATIYSDDLNQIRAQAIAAAPMAHHQFLRGLQFSAQFGDYYFVHAGIRPGIPLGQQDANDLMWIREPFLSSKELHGALIVHGHSISREVQSRHNRIGIDTGAYATGRLTALAIQDGDRWFLTTGLSDG